MSCFPVFWNECSSAGALRGPERAARGEGGPRRQAQGSCGRESRREPVGKDANHEQKVFGFYFWAVIFLWKAFEAGSEKRTPCVSRGPSSCDLLLGVEGSSVGQGSLSFWDLFWVGLEGNPLNLAQGRLFDLLVSLF